MFSRVELQVHEDGPSREATLYRVDFARLSPGLQQQVAHLFTQPRTPAQPTAGAEFYKLTVTTDDDQRFAAEYNEDSAHPQSLELIDDLQREILACAEADRNP